MNNKMLFDIGKYKIINSYKKNKDYYITIETDKGEYSGAYHNKKGLGFLSAYNLAELKALGKYEVKNNGKSKEEVKKVIEKIEKQYLKEIKRFIKD